MLPLVGELALRCAECDVPTPRTELPAIERIPAPCRLNGHRTEIGVDCSERHWVRPEALKLWMMPVSLGRALEHGAREEALPPECNQSFGVEVLGMQRPETHLNT